MLAGNDTTREKQRKRGTHRMLQCFPGLSSAIPIVCGCCGQMQPMLLPCGYPPQLPTHFIYVPFGARSNSGQMTKASSCHTQGCLCWSPSRLHQHKLLLFLRLQQMGTSMNPNTTRKAREDVRCVPDWSPFTMLEVGRLDSCTRQWFPLEVIRHTEVIVWG